MVLFLIISGLPHHYKKLGGYYVDNIKTKLAKKRSVYKEFSEIVGSGLDA